MARKKQEESTTAKGTLADYLRSLRNACGLSLRQVEDYSEVSNGYISQIENGQITKPMPHILHSLCECYQAHLPKKAPVSCTYEKMMALAGHIKPVDETGKKRRGKLPTFVGEELTDEEEKELLDYLAFLRMKRKNEER